MRKPYARALEGIHPVGKKKVPGYELLTCLGVDGKGHLALGYAKLVAYRDKGFLSLPAEIRDTLKQAQTRVGSQSPLICVCDRGFDDYSVFQQILELRETFVICVYHDHPLGGGRKPREVVTSLMLPFQCQAQLKVGEKYQQVAIHFGFTPGKGGRQSAYVGGTARASFGEPRPVVVVDQPTGDYGKGGAEGGGDLPQALVDRGILSVAEGGAGRVPSGDFGPDPQNGGDPFRVGPISLGVRLEGGAFREFLLRLGGKLGIKSEHDGPYLLMRGLIRLLNYPVFCNKIIIHEKHFTTRS